MKYLMIATLCVSNACVAGTFERDVNEIQVYDDRVRVNVGTTYGTCQDKEGWWGWSTSNPRHKDWLSLVLSAQAQGKKITVVDIHSSCAGSGSVNDIIGLEAVFLKI